MPKFEMQPIRTQDGIRRDFDEWEFGLVNFGYVPCDEFKPIVLSSETKDLVIEEVGHHWQEISSEARAKRAEGYWIARDDGDIVGIWLLDEDGNLERAYL